MDIIDLSREHISGTAGSLGIRTDLVCYVRDLKTIWVHDRITAVIEINQEKNVDPKEIQFAVPSENNDRFDSV